MTASNDAHLSSVSLDHRVIDTSDDPRLPGLIEMIRALPPAGDLGVKRERVLSDVESDAAWLADNGFRVELIDAGGVPAQLVVPPGSLSDGLLVTFHGGGFVLCSAGTHARRFALAGDLARCRVLNVEYRLAPEHPFPAALDDAVAAALWAGRRGPFVLAGDSTGANLALAGALALSEQGRAGPRPAGVVALSPWTDLTNASDSRSSRLLRDPFAHVDDGDTYAALYLGGTPPLHPLASPLFADLAGLPPLLVQVGSEETAYDDGWMLAEAAVRAGVPTRFEEWTGMFHTWHTYVGQLAGADDATAGYAAWVADRLRP